MKENSEHNLDQWQELIAGYVLGDLTTEEVAHVNQLLAQYPELMLEVNELQETLSFLPLALPETYPSPSLRSQILDQAQNLNEVANPVRVIAKPAINLLPLVSGLVAILAVWFGLDAYRLRQELAIAQAEMSRYQEAIALLRQPNNRLLALKGMGETPTASGSFVIASEGSSAVLTIQNLAAPPKNKTYRLWTVVDGKKVDCGDFMPDRSGSVFLNIPMKKLAMGATAVVITIESSEPSSEPKGNMAMQGEVSL
jgi:anti-sigma-K factor RskA